MRRDGVCIDVRVHHGDAVCVHRVFPCFCAALWISVWAEYRRHHVRQFHEHATDWATGVGADHFVFGDGQLCGFAVCFFGLPDRVGWVVVDCCWVVFCGWGGGV